jgi:hypothetical protein
VHWELGDLDVEEGKVRVQFVGFSVEGRCREVGETLSALLILRH